jgi:NTE family protein
MVTNDAFSESLSAPRVSIINMPSGVIPPADSPYVMDSAPVQTQKTSVGLVLAGGGAKGAYELGVLEYLANRQIVPAAIAGASIGALNGAVVASGSTFVEGVEALSAVWKAIVRTVGAELIERAELAIEPHSWFDILRLLDSSVLMPQVVEAIVRQAVNVDALTAGIDMWVSVFPSKLHLPSRLTLFPDLMASCTGTQAVYLRLQDLVASSQVHDAYSPARHYHSSFQESK